MPKENAAEKAGYQVASAKGNRTDAPTVLGTHMHGYQVERFFGLPVLKALQRLARAGKFSSRTETERKRGIWTGAHIFEAITMQATPSGDLDSQQEKAKLDRARRQQIESSVIPREEVVKVVAEAARLLQDKLGHTEEVNEALRGIRDLFQEEDE